MVQPKVETFYSQKLFTVNAEQRAAYKEKF